MAEDYGLLKYVRLRHTVVGAAWDEEEQQWRVRVQRGEDADDVIEDKAHVLINASGVLKWVVQSPVRRGKKADGCVLQQVEMAGDQGTGDVQGSHAAQCGLG